TARPPRTKPCSTSRNGSHATRVRCSGRGGRGNSSWAPSPAEPTWSPRWTARRKPSSSPGYGPPGPTTPSSVRRERPTPAPAACDGTPTPHTQKKTTQHHTPTTHPPPQPHPNH